jgi:hypothetical protein
MLAGTVVAVIVYGSWIYNTTYAISAYHHWCCEFKSRHIAATTKNSYAIFKAEKDADFRFV